MWARARFDIRDRDLGYGMRACLKRLEREPLVDELQSMWTPDGDAITAFSVRSGFDLLLQALALDPGSEIMFSALNIKGMVNVAKRLDLLPVPVDLDLATGRPDLGAMERALSPRTKAFVVAPLFGARFDMTSVVEFTKRNGILLIEDCAQAFHGLGYTGTEPADVSMFSFGPLKFATAIGGAMFRVRDPDLLVRMRNIQSEYPVQSSRGFFKRLLKFRGLRLLTTRPVLGTVEWSFRVRGKDYEDAVTDAVRGVAKLGTANKIRTRCAAPLLALMKRRLTEFHPDGLAPRRRTARLLLDNIKDHVTCPGASNDDHNFWAFPVVVKDPHHVMATLRRAGFDAATLRRSATVRAPEDRAHLEPVVAKEALSRLVVIPCYPEMRDTEIERLASILCEAANAPTTTEAGTRAG